MASIVKQGESLEVYLLWCEEEGKARYVDAVYTHKTQAEAELREAVKSDPTAKFYIQIKRTEKHNNNC